MCYLKSVLKRFDSRAWTEISSCDLPKDFVFEFKDEVSWGLLNYKKLNLTLKEVEEYKDYINWEKFSSCVKDTEIIIKFFDLINFHTNSLNIEHPFSYYYGLKDFISPEQFKHLFNNIHSYSIYFEELVEHYDLVKDYISTLNILFEKSDLDYSNFKNKMAQLEPNVFSIVIFYFLLSSEEELPASILEDLIVPELNLSDFFSKITENTEENSNLSNFINVLYKNDKLNDYMVLSSSAYIDYVLYSNLSKEIKEKFLSFGSFPF